MTPVHTSFAMSWFQWVAIAVAVGFLLVVYASPRKRWWVGGLCAAVALIGIAVLGLYTVRSKSVWTAMEAPAPSSPTIDVVLPSAKNSVLDATKPSSKPAEAEAPPVPTKPAKPRPAWVDGPTGRNGGVYREVALVGPYSSRAECDERLSARLQESARAYVADCLGEEAASRVQLPVAFLREHVLLDKWEEPVQASVGPMVQLYANLAFDDTARRETDRLWHEAQVHERLTKAGGGAAVAIMLVAAVYFYLRLGQVASGRLQAGVAGVILGIVTALAQVLA